MDRQAPWSWIASYRPRSAVFYRFMSAEFGKVKYLREAALQGQCFAEVRVNVVSGRVLFPRLRT